MSCSILILHRSSIAFLRNVTDRSKYALPTLMLAGRRLPTSTNNYINQTLPCVCSHYNGTTPMTQSQSFLNNYDPKMTLVPLPVLDSPSGLHVSVCELVRGSFLMHFASSQTSTGRKGPQKCKHIE